MIYLGLQIKTTSLSLSFYISIIYTILVGNILEFKKYTLVAFAYILSIYLCDNSVRNHSWHRFNHLFDEILIQFSLAVWFHSFQVLSAVGFKAWHTDTEYQQHTNIWQQSPMGQIRYLNPLFRLHTCMQSECLRWKFLNLFQSDRTATNYVRCNVKKVASIQLISFSMFARNKRSDLPLQKCKTSVL